MLLMVGHRLVMLGLLTILSAGTSLGRDVWIIRQDGVGPVKVGMSL
jgi:hypothetical protein